MRYFDLVYIPSGGSRELPGFEVPLADMKAWEGQPVNNLWSMSNLGVRTGSWSNGIRNTAGGWFNYKSPWPMTWLNDGSMANSRDNRGRYMMTVIRDGVTGGEILPVTTAYVIHPTQLLYTSPGTYYDPILTKIDERCGVVYGPKVRMGVFVSNLTVLNWSAGLPLTTPIQVKFVWNGLYDLGHKAQYRMFAIELPHPGEPWPMCYEYKNDLGISNVLTENFGADQTTGIFTEPTFHSPLYTCNGYFGTSEVTGVVTKSNTLFYPDRDPQSETLWSSGRKFAIVIYGFTSGGISSEPIPYVRWFSGYKLILLHEDGSSQVEQIHTDISTWGRREYVRER